MIKVVVFDLDDTLTSEIGFIKSGYKVVAREICVKYNVNYQYVYRLLKRIYLINKRFVFNKTLDALDVPYTSRDINKLIQIYREHFPKIRLYSDVKKTLKMLKGYNIKTGIITDGYEVSQKNKIVSLGLDKLIDHIIITDQLGRDFWKPHPKAYELMKEFFNVKYDEMIYVGDNKEKDFVYPNKVNMNTVHIIRKNSIYNEQNRFKHLGFKLHKKLKSKIVKANK